MIHWKDFIIGGMSFLFAYALLTSDQEDIKDEGMDEQPENDVVINGRRFHQMSCQTCRKIKNHREVDPRIFECVKCHRRTNLTAS